MSRVSYARIGRDVAFHDPFHVAVGDLIGRLRRIVVVPRARRVPGVHLHVVQHIALLRNRIARQHVVGGDDGLGNTVGEIGLGSTFNLPRDPGTKKICFVRWIITEKRKYKLVWVERFL